MGFENLFFKKEKVTGAENSDTDELDERGKSRRSFLVGAAALAAASALPMQEAFGQSSSVEPIRTPEDKERNVLKIREHEAYLKEVQDEFARPGITKQEIMDLLHGKEGVPATDQSVLEGTVLDRREFFEANDSWSAVQVRREVGDSRLHLRFGHNLPPDDTILEGSGNSFFVDDIFMSNKHMIAELAPCETVEEGRDIAGCAVDDLGPHEALQKNANRVGLAWDRSKATEDVHGKFAHIPSIHKKRGADRENNTTITSGHIFKITPNFLNDPNLNIRTFFSKDHTDAFAATLEKSCGMIVPSADTNLDGRANAYDLDGISGSPVFIDDDCAEGRRVPSGIQWGALTVTDMERKISYTVVLLHGPEVVGAMVDKVNTIVGADLTEADLSSERKIALSAKIQQALVDYGYRNLGVDGNYGEDTKAVVQAFQEREFDEATRATSIIPGVIDRRTWNALFPHEQDPDKRALWGI
jgi:hypothetical protein